MFKIKYFSGTIELINVHGIANSVFFAIGGIKSKHNRYDSFNRLAGSPKSNPAILMPVTRRIEYKTCPSLHRCDARCQNATGHVCECSCGGQYHGANAGV